MLIYGVFFYLRPRSLPTALLTPDTELLMPMIGETSLLEKYLTLSAINAAYCWTIPV